MFRLLWTADEAILMAADSIDDCIPGWPCNLLSPPDGMASLYLIEYVPEELRVEVLLLFASSAGSLSPLDYLEFAGISMSLDCRAAKYHAREFSYRASYYSLKHLICAQWVGWVSAVKRHPDFQTADWQMRSDGTGVLLQVEEHFAEGWLAVLHIIGYLLENAYMPTATNVIAVTRKKPGDHCLNPKAARYFLKHGGRQAALAY